MTLGQLFDEESELAKDILRLQSLILLLVLDGCDQAGVVEKRQLCSRHLLDRFLFVPARQAKRARVPSYTMGAVTTGASMVSPLPMWYCIQME